MASAIQTKAWNLYDWQNKHAVTSFTEFIAPETQLSLPMSQLKKVEDPYPFKTTPYFASLISHKTYSDPLFAQIALDPRESIIQETELSDPVGDATRSIVSRQTPLLIQKYADRLLLFTTTECASHCRFCFRKVFRQTGVFTLTTELIEEIVAVAYRSPQVREIILTGGDPLMMNDQLLNLCLQKCAAIPHIQTLRIHSRMLSFNPYRLTNALLRIFSMSPKPLWFVSHFNHPNELTPVVMDKVRLLLKAGVPVLNQNVLLRGVNDSIQTLTNLYQKLLQYRIKPYYLHHCDKIQGSSHFRTRITDGILLVKQLYEVLPGHAIPRYMLDLPDGSGKVNLLECQITSSPDSVIIEYRNRKVRYDELR